MIFDFVDWLCYIVNVTQINTIMKIYQQTQHDVHLGGWWNSTKHLPPFDVKVECVGLLSVASGLTYREYATLSSIMSTSSGDFPNFFDARGDVVDVVLWRYIEEPPQEMLEEALDAIKNTNHNP